MRARACVHCHAAALRTRFCCVAAINVTSLKDTLVFAYVGACLQCERVGQVGRGLRIRFRSDGHRSEGHHPSRVSAVHIVQKRVFPSQWAGFWCLMLEEDLL